MRKSIFEIENRIDISNEYKKLIKSLLEADSIWFNGMYMSLYEFIDEYVFNLWEDRGTFSELEEYCKHIGVIYTNNIDEEHFLNFLELMINLICVLEKHYPDSIFQSIKIKNIFKHNIPIILENLNYKIEIVNDRVIIIKRDSDVDSILEIVPDDISLLLLEYNDIRNNNLQSKKTILKKIDLYLETGENKSKFKTKDTKLWDSIGTVVNKMGINHSIEEKPYITFSEENLLEWYDKCFKMMIHLIRSEEISKIKDERAKLVQQSSN